MSNWIDEIPDKIDDPPNKANRAISQVVGNLVWLGACSVEEEIELSVGDGRTISEAIREIVGSVYEVD